jgi:hypothetical protein
VHFDRLFAQVQSVGDLLVQMAERHFREDFPLPGSLEDSSFIVVRGAPGGALALECVLVRFTRVQPGRSLIDAASVPAAA